MGGGIRTTRLGRDRRTRPSSGSSTTSAACARRSRHRVEYPIAIDNDYAVWQAFSNNYWPALYFVDAEGLIRHHQFGEGDCELGRIIRISWPMRARAEMSTGIR